MVLNAQLCSIRFGVGFWGLLGECLFCSTDISDGFFFFSFLIITVPCWFVSLDCFFHFYPIFMLFLLRKHLYHKDLNIWYFYFYCRCCWFYIEQFAKILLIGFVNAKENLSLMSFLALFTSKWRIPSYLVEINFTSSCHFGSNALVSRT